MRNQNSRGSSWPSPWWPTLPWKVQGGKCLPLSAYCVALNQNSIFFSLHPEFPSCLDRSSWKFWRLPSCLWVSSWQRYEQAWKNTATASKWFLICSCCCIVMLMVDVEGSEGSELTFNHIRGDEKCLLWWALLNSWHADPHYQPQFSWICICKTFCIICCWKIWNDIRPCFNEYLFLYKT